MPRVSDDHGGHAAGSVSVNDYDNFAEAYAAENDNGIANAWYERPAIIALAGDVSGRRILDAGRGSGTLFGELRDRGALVTGIDNSTEMLKLARGRLGRDSDLAIADLRTHYPSPTTSLTMSSHLWCCTT